MVLRALLNKITADAMPETKSAEAKKDHVNFL